MSDPNIHSVSEKPGTHVMPHNSHMWTNFGNSLTVIFTNELEN